jgi:hypothetical protein
MKSHIYTTLSPINSCPCRPDHHFSPPPSSTLSLPLAESFRCVSSRSFRLGSTAQSRRPRFALHSHWRALEEHHRWTTRRRRGHRRQHAWSRANRQGPPGKDPLCSRLILHLGTSAIVPRSHPLAHSSWPAMMPLRRPN